MGKALVKNKNDIEDHKKKLNYLTDRMTILNRVSE